MHGVPQGSVLGKIVELFEKLKRNSELAIHWFTDNYLKLNTDKCHLLISAHKHEHRRVQKIFQQQRILFKSFFGA